MNVFKHSTIYYLNSTQQIVTSQENLVTVYYKVCFFNSTFRRFTLKNMIYFKTKLKYSDLLINVREFYKIPFFLHIYYKYQILLPKLTCLTNISKLKYFAFK